jgi:GH35 family endo-1,4-beta-xylanase
MDDANAPAVRALIARYFQQVTIERGYMTRLAPEPGRYDLDWAYDHYNWAQTQGLAMRWHPLIYGGEPWANPIWVYGHKDMAGFLRDYVTTIVTAFPAVREIVAVNEPYFAGHPQRETDPFYAALGDAYVPLVFGTLRETRPDVLMLYNETLNHACSGENGITTAVTRHNLGALKAAGLIDDRFRLGLQMHIRAAALPDPDDFRRTITHYRNHFGCRVIVTEYDLDMTGVPGTKAECAAEHGRITGELVRAYRDAGVGDSFTVWSLVDGYSWLETALGRGDADAGLFDDALRPKPAWAAIRAVARGRV